MLKQLQQTYADQPVRFLLFPCNQFKQEPKANADVKAFAEQYVNLGSGSNVVMFAKSNLNGVPCKASGEGVCSPSSKECCPTNDPVYQYLLKATSPGTIQWNFDKVIVDGTGEPFAGETILHGADVAPALNPIIASLLSTRTGTQLDVAEPSNSAPNLVYPIALALAVLAAAAAKGVQRRRERQATEEYKYEILVA